MDEASSAARKSQIRDRYAAAKGYWPTQHEALLELDPEFLEAFDEFSNMAVRRGALSPKVRELIAIAIDASTTHLYNAGTRNHIRHALRLGASEGEIMEVLSIVSLLGIHTMTESSKILLGELKAQGPPIPDPS